MTNWVDTVKEIRLGNGLSPAPCDLFLDFVFRHATKPQIFANKQLALRHPHFERVQMILYLLFLTKWQQSGRKVAFFVLAGSVMAGHLKKSLRLAATDCDLVGLWESATTKATKNTKVEFVKRS